ncbi:uncharacterized protein LOC110840202 [Zootermopsis nevadensis]|uniref:uncharacterized protein LOC110840202 n=1 Tax=Zootermopsis nevadensis TaxID=136037 RepID=UPI000B8EDABB|nr:uncharacterized protein LOC110840202 [Zootermopsis nevadensis]
MRVSCFEGASSSASQQLPKSHQMEGRNAPPSRRSMLTQVSVGLLANLASISPGMNLGFSAVALPAMRTANDTATLTDDEASWIGEEAL